MKVKAMCNVHMAFFVWGGKVCAGEVGVSWLRGNIEKACAGAVGFSGAYRAFLEICILYSGGARKLPRFSRKLAFVQLWRRETTAFLGETCFCTVVGSENYRVFQGNLLLYSSGARKLPRFSGKHVFVQ